MSTDPRAVLAGLRYRFAKLIRNLDRKIGYNVSREEDNESSYQMLHQDIINNTCKFSKNTYFENMAVPGGTHEQFVKYWRKLEKIF